MRKVSQPLNDGLCIISKMQNVAAPGDMPREEPVEVLRLRYQERGVSYERKYTALQFDMKISRMIRTLQQDIISTDHTVTIGADEYKILDIKKPPDIRPRVMDLTLERVVHE